MAPDVAATGAAAPDPHRAQRLGSSLRRPQLAGERVRARFGLPRGRRQLAGARVGGRQRRLHRQPGRRRARARRQAHGGRSPAAGPAHVRALASALLSSAARCGPGFPSHSLRLSLLRPLRAGTVTCEPGDRYTEGAARLTFNKWAPSGKRVQRHCVCTWACRRASLRGSRPSAARAPRLASRRAPRWLPAARRARPPGYPRSAHGVPHRAAPGKGIWLPRPEPRPAGLAGAWQACCAASLCWRPC